MHPAKSVEPGSSTGQVSPMLDSGDYLIHLAQRIEAQTEAMHQLTDAISSLAESNFALVQAMSESQVDEDMPATSYLSGKPVR